MKITVRPLDPDLPVDEFQVSGEGIDGLAPGQAVPSRLWDDLLEEFDIAFGGHYAPGGYYMAPAGEPA